MTRRRIVREQIGHETTMRVRVEGIAAGGDGVARSDGLVVFVPRSAPGDELTISARKHASLARGRIERIEQPSPARVEPPCIHYTRDQCGGCQIQHLEYGAQLEAKRRIVSDAFARIARRPVDPPDVRPSPAQWRYRRKLTLALRFNQGAWIMGLHPYDAPGAVFHLTDCPITDERVMRVWDEIRAAARDLPESDELRVSVTLLEEGASVVVEGGGKWSSHERFAAGVPSAAALWWRRGTARARLMHERGSQVPGASFVQVNPLMAAELHGYAVERTLAHAPRRVVDAYSGTGDTAEPIARAGVAVVAIELDEDAARWCARRLPGGSRSIAARVEDALPAELPADVVLVNPPRAGLDAAVASTLNGSAARALIYVSCNPATLARDVARMGAYRVASVRAFDMFPQTAHVETVCELVPAAA